MPLVEKAIKEKDERQKKKYFEFLEKMAESKEKLISEIVDFTIMEELHDD